LNSTRRLGYLIAVEGESDCWTGWHHGLPFIGIPGANNAKVIEREHVDGIGRIYVWREPDAGGAAFVPKFAERLSAIGWTGELLVVEGPDGAKDPNDLHRRDPAAFPEMVRAALEVAKPVIGALNAIDAHSSRRASMGGEGIYAGAVLRRLSDVAPERVEWVWPSRIPRRKLTVVDGDPWLGKSTLLFDVAARVTTGEAMPDGVASDLGGPFGVVVLSAEDGLADTIRPRLEAAGADLVRVVALTAITETQIDGRTGEATVVERLPELPRDLARLEEAIAEVNAALVIVDPLMAYLGGDTNAHKDQDIRRALAALAALAERTGVAIVIVRHLNKAPGGSPIYRGGGSIGIIGAARSGLLVAPDPQDETGARRILAVSKGNLAAPPPALAYHMEPTRNFAVRVVWEGPTEHTARQLLAVPEGADGGAETVGFLRDALYEGEWPSADVAREARQLGITDKMLRGARERLGVRVRRQGFGRDGHWLWSLPEQSDGQAIDAPEPIDAHPKREGTYEDRGHLWTDDADLITVAEATGWPRVRLPDGRLVGDEDRWRRFESTATPREMADALRLLAALPLAGVASWLPR
jgi:hypothetical protein